MPRRVLFGDKYDANLCPKKSYWAPVSEPGKIEFFTKSGFLVIQVEIEEV